MRIHVGLILAGQHAVAETALRNLAAITGCNAVVESVLNVPDSLDFAQIKTALNEILESDCISTANVGILKKMDAQIDAFEEAILDKPDMEHHEHEMTGANPPY